MKQNKLALPPKKITLHLFPGPSQRVHLHPGERLVNRGVTQRCIIFYKTSLRERLPVNIPLLFFSSPCRHVKFRLTGGSGLSSSAPPLPLQTPSNRAPPSILFTGGYGCLQSLTRFHYTSSYNLWRTLSTSALITQPSPALRAVICYLFIHLRRRVPRLTRRLMRVCVYGGGGPCECLQGQN